MNPRSSTRQNRDDSFHRSPAERISIQRPAGHRAAFESQGPFRPAGPLQCVVRRPMCHALSRISSSS